MKFIEEMYNNGEEFRYFTLNPGIGKKELTVFLETMEEAAQINEVTVNLIRVLVENKRFKFIKKIADKYIKLYQQFNKEEKITIISATELSESQRSEVLQALKENPQNQEKEFVLEFNVDSSIQGGLQMYTETEFMDMSLQSRMDLINGEIGKLIQG